MFDTFVTFWWCSLSKWLHFNSDSLVIFPNKFLKEVSLEHSQTPSYDLPRSTRFWTTAHVLSSMNSWHVLHIPQSSFKFHGVYLVGNQSWKTHCRCTSWTELPQLSCDPPHWLVHCQLPWIIWPKEQLTAIWKMSPRTLFLCHCSGSGTRGLYAKFRIRKHIGVLPSPKKEV